MKSPIGMLRARRLAPMATVTFPDDDPPPNQNAGFSKTYSQNGSLTQALVSTTFKGGAGGAGGSGGVGGGRIFATGGSGGGGAGGGKSMHITGSAADLSGRFGDAARAFATHVFDHADDPPPAISEDEMQSAAERAIELLRRLTD